MHFLYSKVTWPLVHILAGGYYGLYGLYMMLVPLRVSITKSQLCSIIFLHMNNAKHENTICSMIKIRKLSYVFEHIMSFS